jgi:hypothetical protein
MMPNAFQELLDFLQLLERGKIYYSLARVREETVMVRVDVPGQRWEVEFYASGEVDVEMFQSDGTIYHKDQLKQLILRYSDGVEGEREGPA